MTDHGSIGEHLVQRLRQIFRHPPDPAADTLAPSVDLEEVRRSLILASAGRSAGVEELAISLLAIDRTDDSNLQADAARLLLDADPRAWLAIDVVSRKAWYMAPHWSRTVVSRLTEGTGSPLTLTLASFHPNGYVREAAVAWLSEVDDDLALIPIALRCSDWVEEVRS